MKVNIDHRYPCESEIRTNKTPYFDYYSCLIQTFDHIDSFCDIGCATGHLLYHIKHNDPNVIIKGYEYFDYHKNYAENLIKDNIEIYDIRDSLHDDVYKYDIVNCSEVGEHIDPSYADILIKNAIKLSKQYVIFTWSSHGGEFDKLHDPSHQHLNPLKYDDYIKLMKKHNLKQNIVLTKKFLDCSKNMKDFYYWWRESFVIWEL